MLKFNVRLWLLVLLLSGVLILGMCFSILWVLVVFWVWNCLWWIMLCVLGCLKMLVVLVLVS